MENQLPKPAPLPPNLRLGGYLLERRLARGGFGFTYLAIRLSDMQRVVIKENYPCNGCMRAEGTYAFVLPEGKRRARKGGEEWSAGNFRNEVLALRMLKHPGVATVLDDFYVRETGTSYYVMPYYPGGSLLEVVKAAGKERRKWVLYVAAALMDALEHVHAAGMIHRDIKPENVVFSAEGVPILLDFGAARLRGNDRLTRMVSAEYTPDEQQKGDAQGPWTDIYALGATLYFAITGEHVPVSSARNGNNDPYVPLTSQQNLVRLYGVTFLESVDKALSVKPSERYLSVRSWMEQLQENSGFQCARPEVLSMAGPSEQSMNPQDIQMRMKTAPAMGAEPMEHDPGCHARKPRKKSRMGVACLSMLLLLLLAMLAGVVILVTEPGRSGCAAWELWYLTPEQMCERGDRSSNRKQAVELYSRAAEKSHVLSMLRLGEAYAEGEGVKKNEYEAEMWYQRAADAGYADAQYRLAEIYEKKGNPSAAEKWYTAAGSQGHVEAMVALGEYYFAEASEAGKGMESLDMAETWFKQASEKGGSHVKKRLREIGVERKKLARAAALQKAKNLYNSGSYTSAVAQLIPLAKQEMPEAQLLLGDCYHYGRGVKRNLDTAEEWYGKAVTLGYERADARLKDIKIKRQKLKNDAGLQMARVYLLKKEYALAVKELKPMANDGVPDAQCLLAECYEQGHGVTKNEDEALAWYRKSADQGNGMALYKLADKYRNGAAGEKNKAKADELFRKAIPNLRMLANQGRSDAQQALGLCLSYGYGVPVDNAEAVKWHRRAAQQGCAMSQYMLGRILYHGTGTPKNEKDAVSWYRKAAEQGIVQAQYQLGKCCFESEDDEVNNLEEAEKWLKKAAKSGVCEYQKYLGDFYAEFNTTDGAEKAVVWYEKAAKQGSLEAASSLAFIHLNGGSPVFTHEKALYWFTVAAEKGDSQCQYQLGCCYDEGLGCEVDRKKAREWWRKAAAQGYNEAIDALKSKKK